MLVGLCGIAVSPATAAPGDLDPAFGGAGLAIDNLGQTAAPTRASAVAVDQNGRALVTQYPAGIVRYNGDGSIDSSFSLDQAAGFDFVDVELLPDGKVLALASDRLVRLLPNGDLDQSFGDGGMAKIDPLIGSSAAIAPSGDIAVGGAVQISCSRFGCFYDAAVGHFDQSGRPDSGFDGDGIARADELGDSVRSVGVQPDGRIVAVAGVAVRFTSQGGPDDTFGSAGKASPPEGMTAKTLAVLNDGRIVIAGDIGPADSPSRDFALARLTPDGFVDPAFGSNGLTRTDLGGPDVAQTIAVASNESIVIGGSSRDLTNCDPQAFTVCREDFALARYTPNGLPDPVFGGDGTVTSDFGGSSSYGAGGFQGVAMTGDGRVLAVGNAVKAYPVASDAVIARYRADGALDGGFDQDGFVIARRPIPSGDAANAVAIQPDGKIVVAGHSDVGGRDLGLRFALARYEPDGTRDRIFGSGDGFVTTGDRPYSSFVDVAIQADGRILALGDYGSSSGALVRYEPDGELDRGFGEQGILRLAFTAAALAIQADGRIVVAGGDFSDTSNQAMVIARFDRDGHVDTTFGGGDGVTEIGFGPNVSTGAEDVAVDEEGRIVAAGSGANAFAVVRLLRNGLLDPTFAGDGTARTQTGLVSEAQALALQENGSIIAVGRSFGPKLTLVRYRPDGRLDGSFGESGVAQVQVTSGTDFATDALVDHSRLIVTVSGGNYRTFDVARFTPDGRLDRSFGDDGSVKTSLGDVHSAFARAAAVTPGGQLLVAGMVGSNSTEGDFAMARYELGGPPLIRCGGRYATLVGTAQGENLRGTPGTDVIRGLGGDDRVFGLAGNDFLCGDAGADTIFGGGGRDRLYGGPGADQLHGGPGSDIPPAAR